VESVFVVGSTQVEVGSGVGFEAGRRTVRTEAEEKH